MADVMEVRASETGLVRLFAIDMAPKEALKLRDRADMIAPLLSIDAIDTDHIELFDVADLAGFGLNAYLAEGHGIPDNELEHFAWQLDAVDGVVMLVRSSAILVRPCAIIPQAPVRWIATFGEERAVVPLGTGLNSDGAQGQASSANAAAGAAGPSPWLYVMSAVITLLLALTIWLVLS